MTPSRLPAAPSTMSGWRRRLATVAIAGLSGGALGYAMSWLIAAAACRTGTCPIATDSLPFAMLLGAVAAGSAFQATRR